MANSTPRDVAEFIGLLIETALYGVLFVLTVVTLYILVTPSKPRSERRINWPMLTCSVTMFSLCTGHIAVNAQRCFHAFVDLDRGAPRNAIFNSVTNPLYTAKYTLFFMMLVLGDIMVIYRCFLVWQKNVWVVVLPILLSLASASEFIPTFRKKA